MNTMEMKFDGLILGGVEFVAVSRRLFVQTKWGDLFR